MIFLEIFRVLFLVYTIMLFARIMGSWIPQLQSTRFMQFISYYTDPYLNVFRRIIPPLGMIDLSPIIAFFALRIMENLLMRFLASMVL